MFPRFLYQCSLLLCAAYATIVAVMKFMWDFFPQYDNDVYFNIVFLSACVSVVYLITYLINKKRGIKLTYDFVPKFGTKALLFVLCILFVYLIGKSLLVNSYYPFQWEEQSPILLLFQIVLGPIAEEFVFRGIFLKGLLSNSKYPKWLSIVGVSLLFAILHYDILSPAPVLEKFFTFANALLLSLFMSWLFYRTGNLGNVILIHICANAGSVLLQYLFSECHVLMQEYAITLRVAGYGSVIAAVLFVLFLNNWRPVFSFKMNPTDRASKKEISN